MVVADMLVIFRWLVLMILYRSAQIYGAELNRSRPIMERECNTELVLILKSKLSKLKNHRLICRVVYWEEHPRKFTVTIIYPIYCLYIY